MISPESKVTNGSAQKEMISPVSKDRNDQPSKTEMISPVSKERNDQPNK